MRIIAGKLKGYTLHLPQNKITRPLKDLVRESIFNLLIHSNKIAFRFEKSNILDLYAGSGSFGLECISRGTKNVIFIEKSKDIVKILEKNVQKLKAKENTNIFCSDAFNLIKKNIFKSKLNLIFCDPPFQDKNIEKLIELIFNKNILDKKGIIILHRNKTTKEKLPDYFEIIEQRTYGISKIIFGRILF
tara:strand:+ start:37 stop:603 length:567 start_codon:yes stop_codon:yes gene_type:complete